MRSDQTPKAVKKLIEALTDEQLVLLRAALHSRVLTRSLILDLEREADIENVE